MSAILRTSDGTDLAGTLEEQFIELVCSDEDLLRAEFEAIVAAEWPAPPSAPPPRRDSAGRPFTPSDGRPGTGRRERAASHLRHPIQRRATQRAPPD